LKVSFPLFVILVLVASIGAVYLLHSSIINTDDPPRQVHLSIGNNPDSMYVTWQTRGENPESFCEYGEDQSYGRSSLGIISESAPFVHVVELRSLVSDTVYHYRCGDIKYGYTEDVTFSTKGSDSHFIFTVFGDQGTSSQARSIIKAVKNSGTSLQLHTGDLSYAGNNDFLWNAWFDIIGPLAVRVPYMTAVGNHEYDDDPSLSGYREKFVLPNDERWYSFNWGNTLFISLDLGASYESSIPSERLEWLRNDLSMASKDPSVSWIVVFTHFPFYDSGSAHGSDVNHRSILVPIFEQYGVDIVFSGHEHLYERTYPIMSEKVTDLNSKSYSNPQGIIYVVTGGGGRDLHSFSEVVPEWSGYRESIHHYVMISVFDSRLQVETFGIGDTGGMTWIIDSFIISKDEK